MRRLYEGFTKLNSNEWANAYAEWVFKRLDYTDKDIDKLSREDHDAYMELIENEMAVVDSIQMNGIITGTNAKEIKPWHDDLFPCWSGYKEHAHSWSEQAVLDHYDEWNNNDLYLTR